MLFNLKKVRRAYEIDHAKLIGDTTFGKFHWHYFMQGQMPVHLHLMMFTTIIDIMGSEQQRQELLPKCRKLHILGCYAQTELGHGSDVAGLETTATFDKDTDEFIINTPTPTATKWWPGEIGKTANHAIVFAQLIIDGNKLSPAPFLV